MKAEFDDYAANYDGGNDNWLKRFLGGERSFMARKAQWLASQIRAVRGECPMRVLDFGCGTGLLLQLWSELRPNDSLAGVDISECMLEVAVRRWQGQKVPAFRSLQSSLEKPWPEASFDLVTLSCVLHHVPVDERQAILRQILPLLRPGGRLCIFEHNPRNPLVRWVVRHTAIDRNVILLTADETVNRVKAAGFMDLEKTHMMFWGHYAVMARRPYR